MPVIEAVRVPPSACSVAVERHRALAERARSRRRAASDQALDLERAATCFLRRLARRASAWNAAASRTPP
jgi:hypothetical protein